MTGKWLKLLPSEEFILEYVRSLSPQDFREYLSRHCIEKHFFSRSLPLIWQPYIYNASKKFPDLFLIKEDASRRFSEAYVRNAARILYIRKTVEDLSRLFADIGIEMVAIKGGALIFELYRDEPIRTMSDIDVLIKKDDLEKAEKALLNSGYKKYENVRKEFIHQAFIKSDLVIELHWDIEANLTGNIVGEIIKHKSEVRSGGAKINLPSNEANVFISCINLSRSFCEHFTGAEKNMEALFYKTAFFLNEIKRICLRSGKSFNWDILIRFSKESGKKFEVFTLLLLAEKIVNLEIPEKYIYVMKKDFLVSCYLFLSEGIGYLGFKKLFLIRECFVKAVSLPFLLKDPYGLISNLYQGSLILLYLISYRLYKLARGLRVGAIK